MTLEHVQYMTVT